MVFAMVAGWLLCFFVFGFCVCLFFFLRSFVQYRPEHGIPCKGCATKLHASLLKGGLCSGCNVAPAAAKNVAPQQVFQESAESNVLAKESSEGGKGLMNLGLGLCVLTFLLKFLSSGAMATASWGWDPSPDSRFRRCWRSMRQSR